MKCFISFLSRLVFLAIPAFPELHSIQKDSAAGSFHQPDTVNYSHISIQNKPASALCFQCVLSLFSCAIKLSLCKYMVALSWI